MERIRRSGSRQPDIRSGRPAKRGAATDAVPSGRVHLYVGISLDGYVAAPDGGVGRWPGQWEVCCSLSTVMPHGEAVTVHQLAITRQTRMSE